MTIVSFQKGWTFHTYFLGKETMPRSILLMLSFQLSLVASGLLLSFDKSPAITPNASFTGSRPKWVSHKSTKMAEHLTIKNNKSSKSLFVIFSSSYLMKWVKLTSATRATLLSQQCRNTFFNVPFFVANLACKA